MNHKILANGCAAIAVLMTMATSGPAWAAVPGQTSHQGLLLDTAGQPVSGQVDLVFTLFDALTGGNVLWTESHPNVDVVDGVYDVDLGATTPLTATLLSGGSVFLEIAVEGETLAPRQQLLAVPYALESEHAASADSAVDATNLGGLPSGTLTEMYEHFDFDGGAPPNDDPSEGLGDADNDGIANFVDSDNDNDTISDAVEVAQGSDINLVTPVITGLSQTSAPSLAVTAVTVTGGNFDAGQSVTLGSQSPTPVNLGPSSFDIDIGPQAPGSASLTIVLPNSESALLTNAFTFEGPTINEVVPSTGPSVTGAPVTVNGTNFGAGLSVDFGSETPAPTNLTATSFDVVIGEQAPGSVDVEVTNTDGGSFLLSNAYTFTALSGAVKPWLAVSASSKAAVTWDDAYRLDNDADQAFDGSFALANGGNGDLALAWDAAGVLAGIRCRENPADASECFVELARDLDADSELEDETPTLIETWTTFYGIRNTGLVFDSSGGAAFAYMGRVAHDRDANGDFAGTNELVTISTGGGAVRTGDFAVDPSDRVAYLFRQQSNNDLVLAYDRSGDGDFDDTVGGNPETQTLDNFIFHCADLAFDASGNVAVVYGRGSGATNFLRDLNGDGDFADANETGVLNTNVAQGACSIVGGAGLGLAAAHDAGGDLHLLVDRNDDGDFADTNEDVLLDASNPGPFHVARDGAGKAYVASPTELFVDPF